MEANDLSSPRYELKELAARAGVTTRTIHFYIQQGLLPPAGQPGPGARYSEAHLARLLLIRRLQREHLPLAEIRQRLRALDDQAIVRLAAGASTKAEPPTADNSASALDYIRGLLGETAAPPSHHTSWLAGPAPPPRAAPQSKPREPSATRFLIRALRSRSREPAPEAGRDADGLHDALPAIAEMAQLEPTLAPPAQSTASVAGERSQWERIVLASDIELHIRRPLTRDQNKRVERLVQAAKDILERDQ